MKATRRSYLGLVAVGCAVLLGAPLARINAQQPGDSVRVDSDDIGGVVASAKGPEADVWVIAETTDLPTRFIKIVVTDDRGRYLVPDLPKANYSVWVRGYGLVDSPKVQTAPGKIVNLTAVVAPNPRAAAEYYPALYWYSLLHVPEKSEFPGTGQGGNHISEKMKSQAQWLWQVRRDGCVSCHQLGNKATRELPTELGKFDSSLAAWERRIQSGQAGPDMIRRLPETGSRLLEMYADWTDRIAAGELPPAPPRPQGVERNVVITQWDWSKANAYFHDAISTDKRNPALNANGLIYGVHEFSADVVSVLDPIRNKTWDMPIAPRDPNTLVSSPQTGFKPSRYWGTDAIWDSRAVAHNPMLDEKGRLWMTYKIRPNPNPAFCKEGSSLPSAKLYPVANSGRQLAVYDPKTEKFTFVDTCFGTHHLYFAEDANQTVWTSGGGQVVGWLNRKMFDETGDAEKSQGWTPLIMDTNGNGKQDAWVEPDQPLDPAKDKRIGEGFYGVQPSPADGSIWGSLLTFPGALVRLVPGSNPPSTALAEYYEPPWNNPKAPVQGYAPRGMDVDRNGVVWTVLASGHFASFDRRKCKGPLNGPTATGQQCPEGWTLYPLPGPQFKGLTESGSAEGSYYDWVDQFDTLGLGKNVPIAIGNQSSALLALLPDTGKFVNLTVPYPLGFFAKGLDGRIDDSKGGWKGKGVWVTWGTRASFHGEGGKDNTSKVVKFQLRPDPLAK